jgi:glycosyltransferase involved in cell wall biosynthesis
MDLLNVRVLARFSWRRFAERTLDFYRELRQG